VEWTEVSGEYPGEERMTTVFVANIGTRDIVLNVGDPSRPCYFSFDKGEEGEAVRQFLGCGEGTRAIARHLRRQLAQYADRLKLPILAPALRLALGQVGSLERVVLFATDQGEAAGEHRLWDTIESASLLQQLLPQAFRGRITHIDIIPVSVNPSAHDLAYTFVGEALTRRLPASPVTQVFASIKGGIPALNAALRTHVLDLYGARAALIETHEPSRLDRLDGKEGEARIVSSWPFRKNALLRVVRALLDRYDYSGVQQLLAAEGVNHPKVVALLQHAQSRFNLDFDGAAEALKTYGSGTPHQWKISAREAWGRQRLGELAWTAQILLERKDFVGFVTRVASLCETGRRHVVWHLTRLKLDKGHLTQDEARKHDKQLPVFLDGKGLLKVGGGWKADRELFNALIQWGKQKQQPEVVKAVEEVQQLIGKLGPLEQLRHEALHLIRGISAADIEKAFSKCEARFPDISRQLLEAMATVERMTTGATHFVPEIYQDLNQAILEELEKVEEEEKEKAAGHVSGVQEDW